MKNNIFNFLKLSFIFLFIFCNNATKYEKSESYLDCVRKFVNASLNGDINQAKFYLLKDSLNLTLLEKWHNKYSNLSENDKLNYINSNIIIIKDSLINDSINVITYYNSFKKVPIKIKVKNINNNFLVDLKHTFYDEQ